MHFETFVQKTYSLSSVARSLFDGSWAQTGHTVETLRRHALEDLYVIESEGARFETETES